MGILDTITRATKGPEATTTTAPANAPAQRTPSQIWLNVGINIPGAGAELPDGTREDLFVSLPVGLPLDDMKPVKITGTNQNSIHLKQVKNLLLEELQKAAAGLKPGERTAISQLSVELYRIGTPEQQGTAENNPLIQALQRQLAGK